MLSSSGAETNPQPFAPANAMILRMMDGCTGTENGRIILPSGKVINGAGGQALAAELTGVEPGALPSGTHTDEPERAASPPTESDSTAYRGPGMPDSPLSSHRDQWTGDPELDGAMLVARAVQALHESQR